MESADTTVAEAGTHISVMEVDVDLSKLQEMLEPEPLDPENEWTVESYIRETGSTEPSNTIYSRMERMVEKGELKKRKVLHDGHRCNAYRWA